MARKVFTVAPDGLNITSHVKDVADNEMPDAENFFGRKIGDRIELVTRPGLTLEGSAGIPNLDTDGDVIFRTGVIPKHRQIYTLNREYLDVFAIGNKVYMYDRSLNKMVILYRANGNEPLDIEAYLGHIIVSSHSSNVAVLRKHGRNVFLLDKQSHIIRTNSEIANGVLDLIEADRFEDTGLLDFDIDRSTLYSLSLATGSSASKTVTPIGHAGQTIQASDITLDATHNFPGQATVKFSYDHEDYLDLNGTTDDTTYPASFPGFQSVPRKKISNENISDFRGGASYYNGGKDGRRDTKITTRIEQITKLKRKDIPDDETTAGISSGFTIDASGSDTDSGESTRGIVKFAKTFTTSQGNEFDTNDFNLSEGNALDGLKFFNKNGIWEQSWAGKTLYIGHGQVVSYRVRDPKLIDGVEQVTGVPGDWETSQAVSQVWHHGVYLYWYTGRTAFDYFTSVTVIPQPVLFPLPGINFRISTETSVNDDQKTPNNVLFGPARRKNQKEFCGRLLLPATKGNVNSQATLNGHYNPDADISVPVKDSGFSTFDLFFYFQKPVSLPNNTPTVRIPAKRYFYQGSGEGSANNPIYRMMFIDQTSYSDGAMWEEIRIGKVSDDGNSISYFDEAAGTWLRDVIGYEIQDILPGIKLEKRHTWGFKYHDGSEEFTNNYVNDQSTTNALIVPSQGNWKNNVTTHILDEELNNLTRIYSLLDMPDLYATIHGQANWIDKALAQAGSTARLEYEIFRRIELDSVAVGINVSTDIVTTESLLTITPYNVWFRIQSLFGQNLAKQYINASAPYYIVATGKAVNEVLYSDPSTPVYIMRFLMDIDFENINDIVITDAEELDVAHQRTEDYTIQFPASRLDRLRIRYHSKDNLNTNAVIDSIWSDTISGALMTKINNFWLLVQDTIGNILMVFDNDFNGFDGQVALALSSSYGTVFYSLKSINFYTGQKYVLLHSNAGLFIFQYDVGTQSIKLETSLTASTVTSSPITVSEIRSVAVTTSAVSADIYMIVDGTGDPIRRVTLEYSGTLGRMTLKGEVSGTVNVYANFSANELDFYVNNGVEDFDHLGFVIDDTDVLKMVIRDNGNAMNLVNTLKWQVGGALDTNYDSIIADQNYSRVRQIYPVSTPTQPVVSSRVDSSGTLTGILTYFYVIREYDANDEIIHETYPSEFSDAVNLSATNVVDLAQFPTPYPQFSAQVEKIKLFVYRANTVGLTNVPKLMDFFLIKSDIELKPVPNNPGYWAIQPSDAPLVDNDNNTLDKDRYRGYSNFYPRCKFVDVLNNSIYLLNDVLHQNAIYFSALFDPTNWRPQRHLSAGEFTNDAITASRAHDGLYVFTRDERHLITGVGTNIVKTQLSKEVGCVDDNTLQLVAGVLVGLTEKGFYQMRGYNDSPIDEKVSRITHELTGLSGVVSFYDNYNKQFRFVYDDNQVLAYSVELGRWYLLTYEGYTKLLTGFSRENELTDLTEIAFIVMNKEIDANGNEVEVYRMATENKYAPFDQINGSDNFKFSRYFITKHFDFQNPHNDDIYRRVQLDVVSSHELVGEISVNEGEWARMPEQRKRKYFNIVPRLWFKFKELIGSKVFNHGTDGGYAVQRNSVQKEDGKIDIAYRSIPERESDITVPVLPTLNNSSISGWINPAVLTRGVILSNSLIAYRDVGVGYTPADFTPWLSDSNANILMSFPPHITGTDAGLNNPVGHITHSALVLIINAGGGFRVAVGNRVNDDFYGLSSGDLGTTATPTSVGSGGTLYGAVRLVSSDVSDWTDFADSSFNGLRTHTLPLTGGTFLYYYDEAAWTYAFSGNNSDIFFSIDGSVFKRTNGSGFAITSLSVDDLVIDSSGRTGPAGSATPDWPSGTLITDVFMDKVIADSTDRLRLNIDDCFWVNQESGTGANKIFHGENLGIVTAGGEVAFVVASNEQWTTFSSLPNGLRTVNLHQIGIGQMIIGNTFVVL